jgi:hypothetical protein
MPGVPSDTGRWVLHNPSTLEMVRKDSGSAVTCMTGATWNACSEGDMAMLQFGRGLGPFHVAVGVGG